MGGPAERLRIKSARTNSQKAQNLKGKTIAVRQKGKQLEAGGGGRESRIFEPAVKFKPTAGVQLVKITRVTESRNTQFARRPKPGDCSESIKPPKKQHPHATGEFQKFVVVLFSSLALCQHRSLFASPKCSIALAAWLFTKSFGFPVQNQKISKILVCSSAFLAPSFFRLSIADGLFARNTAEVALLATPAKMCDKAAFSVFVRSRRGPWLCVRSHAVGLLLVRALSGFSISSSKALIRGPFSKNPRAL
jgi:hypothetical protein